MTSSTFNKEIELINEIEELTKEDVLVYFGEINPSFFGSDFEHRLSVDDAIEIGIMLKDTPKDVKQENISIVLQTIGGHISPAMDIINAIKQDYGSIRSIVPNMAQSSGSFLSMSSSEIFMGNEAVLSDFSPQNWVTPNAASGPNDEKCLKSLSDLYFDMIPYLKDGIMKGKDLQEILDLMGELAVKQLSLDAQKKNPKHGAPLDYNQVKTFSSEKVHTLSEIKSFDDNIKVSDKIKKLRKTIFKRMRKEENDFAKLIIYKGKVSYMKFNRNTARIPARPY